MSEQIKKPIHVYRAKFQDMYFVTHCGCTATNVTFVKGDVKCWNCNGMIQIEETASESYEVGMRPSVAVIDSAQHTIPF